LGRPKGGLIKKKLKIKIKVMNWIMILLKLLFGLRRELAEGEVELDEHEMKNTYLKDGALMWRGRRYTQVRATTVQKVAQASFDRETKVSAL
jgi:hypothetical protein